VNMKKYVLVNILLILSGMSRKIYGEKQLPDNRKPWFITLLRMMGD
jgi:hypothetical protein